MPGDELSDTFGALADPTRRAILARLAKGAATVNQLAEPFAVSVQAISKHLKVLERAGLVTRGRSAQQRPARLRGTPLGHASAWLADYRQFWETGFDRLTEHLRDLQKGGNDDDRRHSRDQHQPGL
jgi:DNA-binding transcriptional ArsR family regulator